MIKRRGEEIETAPKEELFVSLTRIFAPKVKMERKNQKCDVVT